MAVRQFEVVQDDRPDPGDQPDEAGRQPRVPTKNAAQTALIASLLLALKAISQRAFIALLDCFALIVVMLAFWLWLKIPDPNINQIVANMIFSLFGLMSIVLVRWWR